MIESQNAMAHEVRSALPGAPTVEPPAAPLLRARRPRVRQVRAALAASLHRAADAVAPAAACSPAR
ncbi:hypothetical protein Daura_10520 [Dactylosporangium aurantiacum]|uniref:Uncharacterized protein n=1 Tax=Dactylosporangium aurantiacum TaxID=35754 RepID=A0A9Q9INX3_9ACTN|nr:hypothetical protein [Dactylosporangium aurantiacum]MDG6109165.1 hypothetical protein [Dactylosporangium aurantiacum]UWZ56565.1 hypothetical protein Daura_10520 [Dactylosporangium aurantiacum]